MTPLEYMKRQLFKHQTNLQRETARGVPEEMLKNIRAKIEYYSAAVQALSGGQNDKA